MKTQHITVKHSKPVKFKPRVILHIDATGTQFINRCGLHISNSKQFFGLIESSIAMNRG